MASGRTIASFRPRVWLLGLAIVPLLSWAADSDQALSTIIVTATRRPTLIQDEPLRVEAVPAEEIEENLVLPLAGLHPERAITTSLDAKWNARGWDVNLSVFDSEIRDALTALPGEGEKFEIVNGAGPRRAPGAEVLIGYVAGALQAIASWSYLHATEEVTPGARQDAPLVPRQAAEIGAILEDETRGRVGLEVGYTGRQALEYDPYRTVSPGFVELNALGELRFGEIAVFLNAINLTDVRQTHYDPLLRPSLGPGGNPITDVWAPLDGLTFNLGIRAEL